MHILNLERLIYLLSCLLFSLLSLLIKAIEFCDVQSYVLRCNWYFRLIAVALNGILISLVKLINWDVSSNLLCKLLNISAFHINARGPSLLFPFILILYVLGLVLLQHVFIHVLNSNYLGSLSP